MYYSLSDDIRALMDDATAQETTLKITLADSTELDITDEKILSGSMAIDRYSMIGEKLELGNVTAHQLTLTLYNNGEFDGYDFGDAQIDVALSVGGNTIECGSYWVTEDKWGISSISLTALDYMSKLDVDWNFSTVAFPCTVPDIIDQIETDLGIAITLGDGGVNETAAISSAPDADATYRTALSWCCSFLGYNQVYVDFLTAPNALKMSRYLDTDARFAITNDHRYSSSVASQDAYITGVYFKNGTTSYLAGSEDYCIDISECALIPQCSTASAVVANLGTAWINFVYRPYTASALAYPQLMPIDTVNFTDVKGVTRFGIISHCKYILNGNSEIKGKGLSPTDAGAKISPLSSTVRIATGSSLVSVDIYYALGTSTTTAPASGWSTVAPTWTSGYYMWQKTVWVYGSGKVEESSPTCIAGAQGPKGADGTSVTILGSYNSYAELAAAHPTGSDGDAYMVGSDLYVWSSSNNDWENVGQIKGDTGTGVADIQEQYYLSTSSSTPTGGSWQTNCPAWQSGYYIWTRSYVTWTDGTTSYTTASLADAINSANTTAASASSTASTANTNATAAVNTANTASTNATTAINTANSASSTATTANNTATAAQSTANTAYNEVTAIKGNIYVSGTTTIDGSVIANGTVTANQINGDGLNVSNATIDTCTINSNCTILGALTGNTIASNSLSGTTGTLTFNSAGYRLESTDGNYTAGLGVGISGGMVGIELSAGGLCTLTLLQGRVDITGYSVYVNGAEIVKTRTWDTTNIDSSIWGTYELHFVSNGIEFDQIDIDGNSWADIAYIQPDGTYLTVYEGSNSTWVDDAYKTMYITWKPHNVDLNTILETHTT